MHYSSNEIIFIAFRSSKDIRKLSQISKKFIASFFDFVPIARKERKKEKMHKGCAIYFVFISIY